MQIQDVYNFFFRIFDKKIIIFDGYKNNVKTFFITLTKSFEKPNSLKITHLIKNENEISINLLLLC